MLSVQLYYGICPDTLWIQKWNRTFFEKKSLKEIGLRIQMNHIDMVCGNPHAAATDFMVLDVNSIHKVAVNFCTCEERLPDRVQLLRYGWFPATVWYPQSCVTFWLLEHFQMVSLASKISVYEYYQGLMHMMDATEVSLPKVSFI